MSIALELEKEFDALLRDFSSRRDEALRLVTPNPEDDEFVRAAIVGFARHCDPGAWAAGHFHYVQEKRQHEYSEESLAFLYDGKSREAALLALMFSGALLGMYQADKIGGRHFRWAEVALPGFLAENAPAVLALG